MPTKKVGFLIKQVHILQEQKLNKKFNRFDLTGAQMFTIINLFKAREKGEKLTQRDLERILEETLKEATPDEDYLSDEIYYYDRGARKIMKWKKVVSKVTLPASCVERLPL